MRKILLLAVIAFTASANLHVASQTRGFQPISTDTIVARNVRWLSNTLSLSPNQSDALRSAMLSNSRSLDSLRISTKSIEERKTGIRLVNSTFRKQAKEILSAEQWKLYWQWVQIHKEAIKNNLHKKHAIVKDLDDN